MKDEKILKKVGKLLTLYGVDEEEKNKFLLDLQDKKYDDQEEVEETMEEKPEDTTPNDEVEGGETEMEETTETTENEGGEENTMEETTTEEVANDSEEVGGGEETVEEFPPTEEVPMENPQEQEAPAYDPQAEIDELKKTNGELAQRLQALENIVSKLGVEETPEETIGESPKANPVESGENDAFARINAKRLG